MHETTARIAQALGLVRSETPTEPPVTPAGVTPPSRAEATHITPREALTLDSVFRALQILQTSAEQLTFDVWRGQDKLTGDQVPKVTRKPDVENTLPEFLGGTVMALATRGNCYWRLIRDPKGQVINARVIDPTAVAPRITRAGLKMFSWDGRDDWTTRDIAHLRFLTMPGEVLGLGPIQAAARTLAGTVTRSRYADEWFDTGHVPSGVLKSDQQLTPDQAEQYKTRWQETQSFANGPAVLGSGLDYQPLLLNPAEVQWLEAQQFGVNGVARLFGIPATYMLTAVDGDSDTYSNQEQADIAYVRFTLMGYLRKIETAMTEALPLGQTARLNVDALLRTDTKTRYEAHQIGIQAGFLSVPEVRAIEGLNPDTVIPPRPAPATTPQESAV